MTQVELSAVPAVIELHVKGGADCKQLAGLVGMHIAEGIDRVTLRCVGAAAVNQAIKAIAIARRFAGFDGRDLRCAPRFETAKPTRPHRSGETDIITITVLDVEVVA